ncbi:taste receptor type 2 member 3 [Perognathus longimembris pacificus]|uniref:taste receptor type 2 member 3 n=1 Tax=Perognathus longimembris pacificus TaxID=214514 RepID=UPI002019E1B1|nr:taste receptor type 2 member 3 [Perognathus longimembris pacificus]
MLEFSEGMFLVLLVIEFILGNLGNGFLGLVNGSSWLKSKKISLPDFIITSLALSRIILLWIIFVDGLLVVFSYETHHSGTAMIMIDITWTFANQLSIWLATCLGVLYCLKIASFSHPTFLWLKWRVSRVVVLILLGALLLSCASTVSRINEFNIYSALNGIGMAGNETEHVRKKQSEYDLFHALGNLWSLPPFVVSLISFFLLFLSLGRHMWQMQQNGISSRDQSTEAHKRAIMIIFSFLFLFLLYLVSFIIFLLSRFLSDKKLAVMIGEVITMLYPVLHSFILILGNPKLKQTIVTVLPCEFGCLKPGSKEPVSP